jgi:fimbrial isopeptide formation D2 family protein/LPXTG-motif cell wall-anchored protein
MGMPVSISTRIERRDIMRFTRNSIASKACVAGLTFATALAMVPTAAFAADLNGNTGDITINGLESGDKVTAYQILKRNYDSSTNNVTDTFVKGTDYTLEQFQALKDDEGEYKKGSAMQVAADNIASSIKANPSIALDTKEATATSETVTFTDAPAGEWLILVTSANGSVTRVYQNTIVSNAPVEENGAYVAKDANATIKYSDETVKKGVGTTRQDAQDTKTADGKYGIGDLVPFVIDTIIPNYPANATNRTFVVGDAPDAGLDIDANTIKVYTVDAAGKESNDPIDATNYTATVSNRVMTITFNEDYIKANPGQEILVKYQAKITSAAKVTPDKTTENSATITFNPNPYEDKTSKPGSKTTVDTYGLFFVKKGDGNALEGAQFKIKYAEDVNGHKAGEYVKDENGKDLVSESDAKGYVSFEDLAKGKYKLEEVSVPSGFQKVDDIDVDLTGDTKDNPKTTEVEANYQELNDVTDPKVGLLPTTGDAGTIGLTAAGICLVAGSAFVIAGRARRSKDDQE